MEKQVYSADNRDWVEIKIDDSLLCAGGYTRALHAFHRKIGRDACAPRIGKESFKVTTLQVR